MTTGVNRAGKDEPGINSNTAPFEGSWMAGQVAEHVLKSVTGAPALISGEASASGRDPAQHVPFLRNLFLDFSTKMKSPKQILPTDAPKDQISITSTLDEILAALAAVAGDVDQRLEAERFSFPGIGALRRLEMLNFLSARSQRHAHQLRAIAEHFKVLWFMGYY